MKRRIRKMMVEAAQCSSDFRIFGYSLIVTDPRPSTFLDERRQARARVDFNSKKIFFTICESDLEKEEEVCLNNCADKDKLCRLARLQWHPALPVPPIVLAALRLLENLQGPLT